MTLDVLSSPDTASERESVRRRRHVWRWIAAAVAVLVIVAGTAFLIKVGTEDAIGWNGGDTYVGGAGAVTHQDMFGAEQANEWAEVRYSPGGTFQLGFTISNMSHTQSIVVRAITFDGLADAYSSSPLWSARLYVDNDPFGGVESLSPFHPFRISPRRPAYIQWTFTMCPSGVATKTSEKGFATFRVDYTYFGFHKSQQVQLVLPLQVDGDGSDCAKSS